MVRSIWTAAERERGYLEGLAAARIPVDRGLIRRDIRSGDEALQAVVELLAMAADRAVHRPELISIGAVRGLRRLGAQRRIALVGFDDVQLADCSIRPSRSWLRIRRRSAGPRPGCSSPGWTAGRVRPSTSWSPPGW